MFTTFWFTTLQSTRKLTIRSVELTPTEISTHTQRERERERLRQRKIQKLSLSSSQVKNIKNNNNNKKMSTTPRFEVKEDTNQVSDDVLKQQEDIYENLHLPDNDSSEEKSNHGSVLMQFLRNLKPGMDTTSLAAPPFVLRPISFLEFEAHYSQPNSDFLKIAHEESPIHRLLHVVNWLLCCFTTTPAKGFEGLKPYNPVLGEQFHCEWHHDDGSKTEFHAEQVSHHPPIAAVYIQNINHHIVYSSTGEFRSRFRGNYVDSGVEGTHRLSLLNYPDEHYDITFPHLLACGILWGNARVEHGTEYIVECEKNGLVSKIDFSKGKHELKGKVINAKKEKLFEIKGNLTDVIEIISYVDLDGNPLKEKKREVWIDCKNVKREKFYVKPVSEQKPIESRRRWHEVTYALKKKQLDVVTKKKNEIEEYQRYLAKLRKEKTIPDFTPELFVYTGRDVPKLNVPIYEYKHKYNTKDTASSSETNGNHADEVQDDLD